MKEDGQKDGDSIQSGLSITGGALGESEGAGEGSLTSEDEKTSTMAWRARGASSIMRRATGKWASDLFSSGALCKHASMSICPMSARCQPGGKREAVKRRSNGINHSFKSH